jgi:hypothetical protein
MKSLASGAVVLFSVVLGTTWGGQGQGFSQTYSSGQGQGGTGITYTPAKVVLIRTVDHEGNVEYQSGKDADSADKKLKDLTTQYEKALSWWERTDAGMTKQGMKSDRPAPVKPIVEVLKKDIPKSDATAAIKSAKDWAVYAIATAGVTKRIVAYAHADAFAKALADAEFGRAYNRWVKEGRKPGLEPQPATVAKSSEAMGKTEAQAAVLMPTKAQR